MVGLGLYLFLRPLTLEQRLEISRCPESCFRVDVDQGRARNNADLELLIAPPVGSAGRKHAALVSDLANAKDLQEIIALQSRFAQS